jgi:DNA-binding SARP family transcriptional activator/tetratricopeptide (TPR) repeat protein
LGHSVPTDGGWEIRLCGPIGVALGGRRIEHGIPGRQGRLLFAYLVRQRDRVCSRAELIDTLWPEHPPAAADTALSALLSKLRRTLGDGVVGGRGGLQLALGAEVDVDVDRAEAEATAAEAALERGDWAVALAHGRAATGVDGASFLPDCDGPWLHEQRRELDAIRLRGLEAVAVAGLRQSGRELQTAEQAARAAVAMAPFRESAHILLMEIHEAAGNPAEALRAFEELRSLLREELGTMPGTAALAVHERLLRGEPPPAAHAPRAVPPLAAHTWPAPLGALTERHRFVGREEEIGSLDALLAEARAGARRLVLLAGEAGIGKTRLAAELARRAHAAGAVVLYGRFDEETLAPYQPLAEMLRGWSGGASLEALAPAMGARAGELGVVLPEFGAPSAPSQSALRGDELLDAQRHRFFDAVAALLAEIAGAAPLLLVLDDLHWADRPTLQLVRHLVRGPQPGPALLLGTYREAELEADHALRELIAGLRREGTLRRLELGGLERREVAELVAALGGADASPSFLAALHAETEGNPFFIEEVVRHLLASAGELGDAPALAAAGVPDGVREVISRRLRRLGEPAREALTVASLIGREFDYDVLEAIAGLEDEPLVAALDEAVEARVLREAAGHVGRYQFAHALIRATLSDGVSALRRARLHGRIGEAILTRRGGDLDPWLPQLARHFEEAAPVDQPERAADFALAAARRADRLLAWEEAAEHYRAALRARELAATVADPVRAELLLALGTSQQRAGLENVARATFAQAGDTARRLDDPALLGRAALGFAGPWSTLARVDEEVVARLDEALAALGEEDSPLRARLLARLGFELYYSGDPGRREALSEEAVAIARRLDDPPTLAACLDARHYALWRPENVEERLDVAAELRRIADQTGDPELELEGAGWTVVDLLERGDVEGADIQIAAASELASALQLPLYRWWTAVMRCTRAQIAGDFALAEKLAGEALELGQRGHAESATNYYAMALYNIRREQGRLGELEGAVRRFIEMYPAIPAWRCTLALLLMELGRPDEARGVFEALAAPGFDALPRDANWLIAVTLLAEVCGALGDAARAAVLHRMLEPYAGRNVVVGRAATCNGAAARLLGILAATMGDWDAAERRFDEADALHAAMGARPWIAHTQLARGAMLLARGDAADHPRVRALLGDAIVLADALGMVSVAARARHLVAQAGSVDVTAAP